MMLRNLTIGALVCLSGTALSVTRFTPLSSSVPGNFAGLGPRPMSLEKLASLLPERQPGSFTKIAAQIAESPDPLTGYVRVLPDVGTTVPSGFALLSFRSNGLLITETSVPASTAIHGGRVYIEAGGAISTGIAVANPNDQDAVISFHFTDASGRAFGHGSFILDANRQTAGLLTNAPFNGPRSMLGSFQFAASMPIAVAAFRGITNERSEFIATALPVWHNGQSFDSALLFPELAESDGWDTLILLSNNGSTELNGSVEFYDRGTQRRGASRLRMRVNGTAGYSFPYRIPPRGMVRMITQTVDRVDGGSVHVVPGRNSSAPAGLSILTHKRNNVTVSQAAVPAMASGRAYRTYVQSQGRRGATGSVHTRLAIANPSRVSAILNLELTTLDGKAFGGRETLVVPAGGQIVKFIDNLFENLPGGFHGILHITSSSPVAMNALRGTYNQRRDFLFTTTAPSNVDAPPAVSTLIIPQIVAGEGYTTQFTLFSGSRGDASGRLLFVASNGTFLPPEVFRPVP
jgi:hypothetical protein